MENFLEGLRSLPNSKKRLIVWGVSLGLTGIIGLFWFVSVRETSTTTVVATGAVNSPFTEIQGLGARISDAFSKQFGSK